MPSAWSASSQKSMYASSRTTSGESAPSPSRKARSGARRMIVVAGLCGEQRMTAFVRAVTLRRTSSRSVSYPASGLDTTRAPASVAAIAYGSKAGSGTTTSSPGSNAAAAISVISSSAPLPTRSWACCRPCRRASAARSAVEPPSG